MPASYTDLGDVNLSMGTFSLPGGTYLIHNLSLSGTVNFTWDGPVTLYIENSYNVSGSAAINTYQNIPANRTLYFLPTCTSATWNGTNICVGTLYAPDTDFTISGSVEMFGRIVAKSINNTSSGGCTTTRRCPLSADQAPIPRCRGRTLRCNDVVPANRQAKVRLVASAPRPMEKLCVTQYEWFANEDGTLLGTVVFDPADQSWGSVILEAGLRPCRVVQITERLATQQDARLHLLAAMDRMDAPPAPPPTSIPAAATTASISRRSAEPQHQHRWRSQQPHRRR
jgi:hypothetical protein